MKTIVLLFGLFLCLSTVGIAQEPAKTVRYALIEAPCKPEFNAANGFREKAILTNIIKVTIDTPFDLINAETKLISSFEVALEKQYPNSRNHVQDILVYLLNTEKEARELYNRKVKTLKMLETGIIPIKVQLTAN